MIVREEFSTKENDKSPSVYGLNGFAVKLTFTNTENFDKSAVTYEAAPTIVHAALPVAPDTAADRVEKITDQNGTAQDVTGLTSSAFAHPPHVAGGGLLRRERNALSRRVARDMVAPKKGR